MKFLYLILLTTATFCYDSQLLNYPEVLKAKYEIFDIIKKEIYSNPMPDNYKDYIDYFEFSGYFFFDIIPVNKLEQEFQKIVLLSDNEDEKGDLLRGLNYTATAGELSFPPDTFRASMYGTLFFHMFRGFSSKLVTTSNSKFIMFYYIKALTTGSLKKLFEKIKMCSKTNSIFKKCGEYDIGDAVWATAKAYAYSKIKEKMSVYN